MSLKMYIATTTCMSRQILVMLIIVCGMCLMTLFLACNLRAYTFFFLMAKFQYAESSYKALEKGLMLILHSLLGVVLVIVLLCRTTVRASQG